MSTNNCVVYMPSFYLAAKYSKRRTLLPIAKKLRDAGYGVKSQWIDGTHRCNTEADKRKYAALDLQHIDNCTHFVLFNLPIGDAEPSGGRNVELGYALAKNKNIYIVGESNCIFYSLATKRFASVYGFLNFVL